MKEPHRAARAGRPPRGDARLRRAVNARMLATMEKSRRVLIGEDDRQVRETGADYLSTHGYEVGQAADGASMRKALAAELPDLVLVDLRLPGEDGLTLGRASCRERV